MYFLVFAIGCLQRRWNIYVTSKWNSMWSRSSYSCCYLSLQVQTCSAWREWDLIRFSGGCIWVFLLFFSVQGCREVELGSKNCYYGVFFNFNFIHSKKYNFVICGASHQIFEFTTKLKVVYSSHMLHIYMMMKKKDWRELQATTMTLLFE